jgi:hypothetical protein
MRRKEHRTVFRWNDGEEAGHGNGISGDDGFMADCVIVCFFSLWFVLSGSFLSICHSVSFGFYGGAPGGVAPGGSAPGGRSFVLYIRSLFRRSIEGNNSIHLTQCTLINPLQTASFPSP